MPSVFEDWHKKSDKELLKVILTGDPEAPAYQKAKLLIETRNGQRIRRASWAIVLFTGILALFSLLNWLKEDPAPSPSRGAIAPVEEGSSLGR